VWRYTESIDTMDRKNIGKNSKFENLEQSLYDPSDTPTRIRTGAFHQEEINVEQDWNKLNLSEEQKQKTFDEEARIYEQSIQVQKSSFFKRFFMTSLLFFLVAIGFGVYTFFLKSKLNPEGNITISVIGSTFTQAGESLPLTVEILNNNNFALEIVDLIVEYPKEGERPTANLETTERERISIGTIEANKRVVKEVPLTLFGKEGDKKEVHFILEYSVAESSAIFQKEKIYVVTLNSSPITTRIIASNTAVPDQPYRFTVEVSTNTKNPLENILLAVQYPAGYTYQNSSQETSSGNNIWDIGTLKPGEPKQIEINGIFSGLEGDERSIRTLFGTYMPTDQTKISTNLGTQLHTVLLQKPFLSTELVINGSGTDSVVLSDGEQIQGQILWKNNLLNQVFDLEIQVKLKGNLLDRENIESTDGFYNSQTDSIIWNKNTMDTFVRIPAESGGVLYFTIPMKKLPKDGSQKNPTVEFEVVVRGLEDSDGKNPKTIESLERVVGRIGGDAQLVPFVQFTTGPISNTGTYPPKVDQEITYTVALPITNTVNEFTQGEIRAKLPPNVVYKNVYYPTNEQVRYDEKTAEIIWRIGDIPATGEAARTLSVQLGLTPSLSQLGVFAPLLQNVSFTAVDAYTNKSKVQNIGVITNEIRNRTGEDPVSENGRITK
jgi:hypothetical protein